MPELKKTEYPERWIPVHALNIVWAKTQRNLNDGKVKAIMDAFDPDALGTIIVTLPDGDGIHHIIDGQHRVEAVRRLWGSDQRVPCRLLDARKPSEAAEIWMKINTGRFAPTQIDRFKIAVQAGRQPELEVDGIIRGHGYTIDPSGGEGVIRAVNACMKVRKRWGIVILKEALETIQACWGMDKDSTHQGIIGGFGEILGVYHLELDKKRLVEKVSKKHTPTRLIAAARTRREFDPRSLPENTAVILRSTYNTGLSKNRLDDPA